MKKPLAIILAFFIVFSPVYSYAVLPALIASAASAAGRVLVGNGVKKVSQTALARSGMGLVGLCKKYPYKCASLGLGIGSIISNLSTDEWEINIGGEGDTTNNINIEIYKIPVSDTCEINVKFGRPNNEPPLPLTSANADYERVMKSRRNGNPKYPYEGTAEGIGEYTKITNRIKAEVNRTLTTEYKLFSHFFPPFIENDTNYTTPRPERVLGSTSAYYACLPPPTNKIYITDNEFYQIMQNNVSADDIKNIYNYDYSQHPNITINNNSYGGNTINNDLSVSVEPELKVSPSLKLDIESNKVNLDNINDQNCTKNEAGEYDKCGDTEEPTDPENPDPDTPVPPKPSPIECDANGFYKKVCDWMDWTQKPHDKPDSGNVDIIDKSEWLNIDQNRIDFTNQCPAPTPINTSVGGFPVSTELNYQPLCDFFEMLNPFVIGMGGISSALIIAGGARRG